MHACMVATRDRDGGGRLVRQELLNDASSAGRTLSDSTGVPQVFPVPLHLLLPFKCRR